MIFFGNLIPSALGCAGVFLVHQQGKSWQGKGSHQNPVMLDDRYTKLPYHYGLEMSAAATQNIFTVQAWDSHFD